MNNFEGVRTRPIANKSVSNFEGVRTRPAAIKEDNWAPLLGKSAAKGVVDTGKGIVTLADLATTNVNGYSADPLDFGDEPEIRYNKPLQASGQLSELVDENIGEYITPEHGDNSAKKIIGTGVEWATPGGILGKFAKRARFIKPAMIEAALGGVSGGLQVGGVDPLIADLSVGIGTPVSGAVGRRIKDTFSSDRQKILAAQELQNFLKAHQGEKGVEKSLKAIEQYNQQNKHFKDVELITPEIAQDMGLSSLAQAKTSGSQKIQNRLAANDEAMLRQIENLASTGIDPNIKGQNIRSPILKKYNKAVKKRAEATEPLYEALEAIDEGIDPTNVKEIFTAKRRIAGPDDTALIDRFEKKLVRNNLDPEVVNRIDIIENQINSLKSRGFSKEVFKEVADPLYQELSQLEKHLLPIPAQLDATMRNLDSKIITAAKSGDKAEVKYLKDIKNAYFKDLSKNPDALKPRVEYNRYSEDINKIDKSPLLSKFVKKNRNPMLVDDFIVPDEKIASSVYNADLQDTRRLLAQAKGNKQLTDQIQGVYLDELLGKAQTGSGELSYDKISKFLKKEGNKDKVPLIFNKQQRNLLKELQDNTKRRYQSKTKHKINQSGSDTQPKGLLQESFDQGADALIDTAASATGLGGARKGYKFFKEINKGNRQKYYDASLEDVVLNPLEYQQLMNKIHKPKNILDFYNPRSSISSILRNSGRD